LSFNFNRYVVGKILSIFGFFIIIFCLYITAQNPGVQGYEISIYDEYPKYFWYLIIVCILIFQIIIFIDIFSNNQSSLSWKIACLGMVLCNSIIILLPLIRSYAILGRGDCGTHLGYMLEIQQTGNFGRNTYPIAHILGVISADILSLPLNISMLLYPFIFYVLFVLSFYLLHRITHKSRTSTLIGMMLVPLLYFGNGNVMFFPQGLANYFVLFVLYLIFYRNLIYRNYSAYALLIVVSCIFSTFFHPLVSLFLILTLVIHYLSCHLFKRLKLDSELTHQSFYRLIIILLAVFFSWQFHARILLGTFKQVNAWFFEGTGEPTKYEKYSEIISEIQPDIYFLIKSFIFSADLYGVRLLFTLMGIISVFIIIYGIKKETFHINPFHLTCAIGLFICFPVYIVSQFIIYDVSYVRLVHYAVIFSIILTSAALGFLIKTQRDKTYNITSLCIVIFFLLIFATYLTVFCVHVSPILRSPGHHVAESELVGMNTFFKIRFEELSIMEGGISVSRMKDALYGRKELQNVIYYIEPTIPDHFNYTKLTYFGDYYERPRYVVISTPFRIGSPEISPEFPERWRFNETDFLKLENDSSVSKFYTNRELDVYLTRPVSNNLRDYLNESLTDYQWGGMSKKV